MTGVERAETWSMEELVELAAAALAVGYGGPPTARARDLPDVRAVRWYVTRGLVDRPLVGGRVARCGRRHRLPRVAVKRRQADGRSLAEIQAELTGATDQVLAGIARLPANGVSPAPAGPPARRRRFWSEPAAEPAARRAGPPDAPALVRALSLAPGITLLVEADLGAFDAAAVRRAARPLLELIVPAAQRPEGEDRA
jgi:hypothetical protein